MTEVIVYQAVNSEKAQTKSYTAEQRQSAYNISTIPARAKTAATGNIFSGISKILAVLGIGLILITVTPGTITWVKAQTGISNNFKLTQTEVKLLNVTAKVSQRDNLPPQDSNLPLINHLSIPSIGVNTDIQEAPYDGYEEALKKGVWRVTDFGAPYQEGTPTILAAHRFGYLAWTDKFRHDNSFFNLPKLKVGDTLEIVYQQRKYTYEVYAENTGPEIMDYTADLILYTCENLTGDTRIFKYARLINL
jgi:LPXTG-site transpeptidase (sortase) family protein